MLYDVDALDVLRWQREALTQRPANGGEVWMTPFTAAEIAAAERIIAHYRRTT